MVTHSGAVEFWTGCMAPGGCGASWFIVGEEDMTTAMVAARVARAREKKRSGRDSARPHRTPPHTTALPFWYVSIFFFIAVLMELSCRDIRSRAVSYENEFKPTSLRSRLIVGVKFLK